MSEQTVDVGNCYIEVEVTHFKPYVPVSWGSTPEDSDEGEEYELEFEVIKAVHIPSTVLYELPRLEDIVEALVDLLH